ncbi:hypothetical protein [Amycolatopsis sulphurea]|uniref:hypothetical protein n=1 Tax=Amycolatopsis sulphurea TaxID=76022 RepID=UPI001FEA34E4|nr:hypothetical protein [Amycolatopsis sulphurea]
MSAYQPDPAPPVVSSPDEPYRFGPTGQSVNPIGSDGQSAGGGSPGDGVDGGSGRAGSPRGGPGSGAGKAAESASARGAPPRATEGEKNGAMAGPGMAGRKKDDDKEKKSPAYLREADSDGLFGGSDVRPVPPVLGEMPRQRTESRQQE